MNLFDDAAKRNPRHLMSLLDYQFEPFLANHVATVNYTVCSPSEEPRKPTTPDKIFHSNNSIWEAVIHEQVRRSDIHIVLESFFLFEWFPRSPGLFHTPTGISARREAERSIESINEGVVVYNPYGKFSMLEGGVGNVRLKPIRVDNEDIYLMSASSNGDCHEGFPVGLPSHLYNQCIEEIAERGAVVRTLIGKLKFVPSEIANIYRGYAEVPQLYLSVEKISSPAYPKSLQMEELEVSVAVSFLSAYEGTPRVYASYVNFDPSNKHSFRDRVTWMEQDYVVSKYKGQVITDFDEQRSHFASAPFSLEKVMNLRLNQTEVSLVANEVNVNSLLDHQAKIQIFTKETYMANKYNITGGQQGAVGDNAEAHNFTQTTNQGSQQPVESAKPHTTRNKLSPDNRGKGQYSASLWEKIVAIAMAALIVVLVMYLVIRNEAFADPNLVRLLRIILSVAAGILGATIPGFLDVKWSGGGFIIRAGGALALFVITFFGSPSVILLSPG